MILLPPCFTVDTVCLWWFVPSESLKVVTHLDWSQVSRCFSQVFFLPFLNNRFNLTLCFLFLCFVSVLEILCSHLLTYTFQFLFVSRSLECCCYGFAPEDQHAGLQSLKSHNGIYSTSFTRCTGTGAPGIREKGNTLVPLLTLSTCDQSLPPHSPLRNGSRKFIYRKNAS